MNCYIPSASQKRKIKTRKYEPYLLLLPAMIIMVLLVIYPIIRTFSLSTMSYALNKPNKTAFIGIGNFLKMLGDKKFFSSLGFSVQYSLIVVAFQLVMGLSMALLMRDMKHFRGLYRGSVFAPWAVSGVLTAIVWKMMFNGSYGAINDLGLRLGMIADSIPWGTNRATAFIMVIVASVWRGIPYFAITMLAALTSIPADIYESGRIDGAGSFRLFINITLPYLRETIVLSTLLRLIWTFNDVDIVYSLTAGGPNNATLTLPVYITRTAVEYLDFGYGSALTIGLFIVMLAFSLVYLRLGKSDGDFSA